jgi:hypothetical protein
MWAATLTCTVDMLSWTSWGLTRVRGESNTDLFHLAGRAELYEIATGAETGAQTHFRPSKTSESHSSARCLLPSHVTFVV